MTKGNREISRQERWLHWIVALGVIALIGVGLYMSKNEAYHLYTPHKSIGIILFIFILWRVVKRLRMGWPENISNGPNYEHKLAKIVHWILIIGTILMPISGMIYSWSGGHGLGIFGWTLITENLDAAGKTAAINLELAQSAHQAHGVIGKVLVVAILLHLVGALKHHFMDKDATLVRMISGKDNRSV